MIRQRRPKGQRKTTCSCCGNESRPGQRYCIACHAKYMREHRPMLSELKPDAQFKAIARSYANTYLKRGQIEKKPCEICNQPAQMHHEDYSKPLSVRWFCRKHHLELHKKAM